MGVEGEIAVVNETGGGINEVDTNTVVAEIAVDDVDVGTVGEEHPSFIIVVIAGS